MRGAPADPVVELAALASHTKQAHWNIHSTDGAVRKEESLPDLLVGQSAGQLAAAGLSNREIGHRLYLSHPTISTHLYRVFPKLGITSRAELNAVLASATGTR